MKCTQKKETILLWVNKQQIEHNIARYVIDEGIENSFSF